MTAPIIPLPVRRALRQVTAEARAVAPVIDLDDHREAALQRALDEQASGLAVRSVWAVRLKSGVHPTAAHLVGVAEALEEVADCSSWEEALERLDQISRGCRRVAGEL